MIFFSVVYLLIKLIMKKVIRLTESELTRLVKRIIIESEEATSKGNKFCIKNVKQWEDSDDDVHQSGTWSISGNKIGLTYKGFVNKTMNKAEKLFGVDQKFDMVIPKPNGFDQWRGNKTMGKMEKGSVPSGFFSFDGQADYSVCFTK